MIGAQESQENGCRESHNVTLNINSRQYRLVVDSNWTLSDFLRNRLALTATKRACDYGSCGSCAVLIDGVDVYSCSILAVQAEGKEILTIEALGTSASLHPLQKSFARSYAAQSGWRTPGMINVRKGLARSRAQSDGRRSENRSFRRALPLHMNQYEVDLSRTLVRRALLSLSAS
jgi:aerobic-type carbon monoxide dehydrogenase small subunit (CoxS/CutS family)